MHSVNLTYKGKLVFVFPYFTTSHAKKRVAIAEVHIYLQNVQGASGFCHTAIFWLNLPVSMVSAL